MQDFSHVVETVKRLSTAEKEELQSLLKSYLIEERRLEIEQNHAASLRELSKEELSFSDDINKLREVLSHD